MQCACRVGVIGVFVSVVVGAGHVHAGSIGDPINITYKNPTTLQIEVSRLNLNYDATSHTLTVSGFTVNGPPPHQGTWLTNNATGATPVIGTEDATLNLSVVLDSNFHATAGSLKVVDTQTGGSYHSGTFFDATIWPWITDFQFVPGTSDNGSMYFRFFETGSSVLHDNWGVSSLVYSTPIGVQIHYVPTSFTLDYNTSSSYTLSTSSNQVKADIYITDVPAPRTLMGASLLLGLVGVQARRRAFRSRCAW